MTVKGGTTPACAVCKYQRRKCSPVCPLAPYFPANQPQMFQSVHRLYGVSNVTKILDSLHTKDHKEDAMRSIIYESEMRERFPVHGCSTVVAQLQLQLRNSWEELRALHAQIAACKEQLLSHGFDPAAAAAGPSNYLDVNINHHESGDTFESIQAQMNAFGIQDQQESKVMYLHDFEDEEDRFVTVLKSSPADSPPMQETTPTLENIWTTSSS